MTASSPPPDQAAATGVWPFIFGIAFILCWVGMHFLWGYVFLVGGVVLDIAVAIIKPVLFPGMASAGANHSQEWSWNWTMFAGITAAGLAGVPAGLAFFWRDHRGMLLLGFMVLFAAGVLMQLQTCWARLVGILTPPA